MKEITIPSPIPAMIPLEIMRQATLGEKDERIIPKAAIKLPRMHTAKKVLFLNLNKQPL